jgi:hypothetical protein
MCQTVSTGRILTGHDTDVKPCDRVVPIAHKFRIGLDFLTASMPYENMLRRLDVRQSDAEQ